MKQQAALVFLALALGAGVTPAQQVLNQQQAPPPPKDGKGNVVVMGQFNYPSSDFSVLRWAAAWASASPQITEVVLAVPGDGGESIAGGLNSTSARYFPYGAGDRGFISPYANIANLLRNLSSSNATPARGLLYVHDDIIITKSILKKMGGTKWVSTEEPKRFKIYPSGNITLQAVSPHWPSTKNCTHQLSTAARDARLANFYANGELPGMYGQSDMLYVPLHDKRAVKEFVLLLDIFSHHRVFLECALPTIVEIMKQRFHIEVYYARLCTSWQNQIRHNPIKLIKSCGEQSEAYHPIKLDQIGADKWTELFNSFLVGGDSSIKHGLTSARQRGRRKKRRVKSKQATTSAAHGDGLGGGSASGSTANSDGRWGKSRASGSS